MELSASLDYDDLTHNEDLQENWNEDHHSWFRIRAVSNRGLSVFAFIILLIIWQSG